MLQILKITYVVECEIFKHNSLKKTSILNKKERKKKKKRKKKNVHDFYTSAGNHENIYTIQMCGRIYANN